MLSGRRLDLLDPSPVDVEISDIARGIACVARWNGQTKGDHAFSVAEHSLIVADICVDMLPTISPKLEMMALLHDASEYVIGDMISPFKNALGLDYRQFEDRLETAIHIRFGLPARPTTQEKKLIKQADLACAYYEATQLAGFSVEEADKFFDRPQNLSKTIITKLEAMQPLSVRQAEAAFLSRFAQINVRL
ncbi:MAG: HD family hydrolase [OCS116 cluster bacterium]|uniref:HD/PDEase domain-containing protein n=1 Tax=OCS116 cluster bacterium TaxID=2030921 RepID=A0A2A4Z9J4_9PROT|nr:HD family hydrolase [OCS116 cluster bacterium]